MNGELAQVVALATHGTIWLRATEAREPPALEAGNSTFQFVKEVEFGFGGGPPRPSVADWLRDLHARGMTRLWLDIPDPLPLRQRWPHLEPHIEVSFSNGGRWQLLATGANGSEFWRPSWTVGPLDAVDRKIWSVRYDRAPSAGAQPAWPDVRAARAALEACLADIGKFAEHVHEEFWASQFASALEANVTPEHHPDMLPGEFPLQARELVAMASRAWVFGGMGSWNDLGFTDGAQNAEYEALSRLLFATVIQACVAAVNCPLTPETR